MLMRHMKDPYNFRLNDVSDPDRTGKMTALVDRFGIDPASVLRRCFDAYVRFCHERGTPPNFPVVLIPEEEFAVLQEKSSSTYRAKKK